MRHIRTCRVAVAGLAVASLAVASPALTACTAKTTAKHAARSFVPPLTPAQALNAAVGKLHNAAYDVAFTFGDGASTATGSVDPAATAATMEQKGAVGGTNVDVVATQVGSGHWTRMDLGSLNAQLGLVPAQWMSIDVSRLTGATRWPFDLGGPDVLGITGLLTSVTVHRTDATHLAGTVDLTTVTGVNTLAPADLTKAGAAAKATPFTVTLDAQGRLASLAIDADTFDKDLSESLTFSQYGVPTPIVAPDLATVIPAPDSVYQILNES